MSASEAEREALRAHADRYSRDDCAHCASITTRNRVTLAVLDDYERLLAFEAAVREQWEGAPSDDDTHAATSTRDALAALDRGRGGEG